MNGLNQVRDAIIASLQGASLCAVPAWEGKAKRYDGAVVSVDIAQTAGKSFAMGSYLGQVYDAQQGTVRELYGRRLEATIVLEVRAPVAAECEEIIENACDALSQGLPSGLKLREQSWDAVSWDSENQMFLRRGELQCDAYFTAETEEEEPAFLDFTLKGVLKN